MQGRGILADGAIALTAAYPFAVYLLLDTGSVRFAGLVLLVAIAVRWLTTGNKSAQILAVLAPAAAFAAAIAATNSEVLARLYPAVVSAVLLGAFGLTLRHPPSIIERIARSTGHVLDDQGMRYTRNLTMIWCGFFAANGTAALGTALFASRELWAIYNGLVSYFLVGALFIGERLIRPVVLRRIAGSAAR